MKFEVQEWPCLVAESSYEHAARLPETIAAYACALVMLAHGARAWPGRQARLGACAWPGRGLDTVRALPGRGLDTVRALPGRGLDMARE